MAHPVEEEHEQDKKKEEEGRRMRKKFIPQTIKPATQWQLTQ